MTRLTSLAILAVAGATTAPTYSQTLDETDKAIARIAATGPAKPFISRSNIYGIGLSYDGRGIDSTLAKVKKELVLSAAGTTIGLNFQQADITNTGLAHLRGIKKLRVLRFENANVTDAGLPFIKDIEVERLGLGGTKITDAGIATIKDMDGVTYLELQNTRLTDAAVKHLAEMKGLKELFLTGTRITPKGIAALREALPGTEISAPIIVAPKKK